jgi:hypothetical protein
MNWTAVTAAAILAQTAGLAACLYLFFLLKRENAELRRTFSTEVEGQQEVIVQLRMAVRRLEERPAGEAPRPAAAEPAHHPAPALSLNLNKRSQALRMHRRGDPPEAIASALHLPRNEVELLLKVHRSFSGGAG